MQIIVQITEEFPLNTYTGHITFVAVSSMRSSMSSSDILGIAAISDRLMSAEESGTMCLLNVPFCWTLSISIPDKTRHNSRITEPCRLLLNASQLCVPPQ